MIFTRILRSGYTGKFNDPLQKILHPIGFIKYKMNMIDNARAIYEHCADQYESNTLTTHLKLSNDFESWFAMTTLHLWMINKRLFDEREFNQEVVQHLWLDVEIKLHQAGVKTSVSQIISDLVSSYQGQCLGHDEGLFSGDALFAASLWRNLMGTKDVLPSQLVQTLFYIRENLVMLEGVDVDLIVDGKFKFTEFKLRTL